MASLSVVSLLLLLVSALRCLLIDLQMNPAIRAPEISGHLQDTDAGLDAVGA
ncbi:MAG: hypothetical protein QOE55_3231 [Acidobacteriaceae bacterium]|jgi:hypothetical protein|nr:hypothetical protein [Acidobacteriaceae bacterium]